MIKTNLIYGTCKECGQNFTNNSNFTKHLKFHNMTIKDYYDKHFKDEEEGKCKKCGAPTDFDKSIQTFDYGERNLRMGYLPLCKEHKIKGFTKEKAIYTYGEEEGLIRWEHYCSAQERSNSFEYKQEKHGWTKEQYDEYNSSRAVTLENLTRKYGPMEGKRRFESYCEKQKYVGCALEYFQEKYGEEEGRIYFEELNKSKAQTCENFQKKYGDVLGEQKYIEYMEGVRPMFSKDSQELFWYVYNRTENSHIHFAALGKEFGKYDKDNKTYYFYDYVDSERKKVIEYNGMLFHARSPDDETFFNPRNPEKTAKESWERDTIKRELMEALGFEYCVVWECDFLKDKERVKEECLKFLLS